MKRKNQRNLWIAVGLFVTFVLWTVLITFVDVQPIGPEGSEVGFASLNGFMHELLGEHMLLYTITDWLSLVPLFAVLFFGGIGLAQLVKRKSLGEVDRSILLLGIFYLLVAMAYVFFEVVTINYRPVLINGHLEGSYPSSTTMLVMCVMLTASGLFRRFIPNDAVRKTVCGVTVLFTVFMVGGRLISGVHWFTDIVGAMLLSVGLIMAYHTADVWGDEISR